MQLIITLWRLRTRRSFVGGGDGGGGGKSAGSHRLVGGGSSSSASYAKGDGNGRLAQ